MAQHTPLSEQRRLVARWRKSGMSMNRFAESVGVPDSTFWRWTRKYPEGHRDGADDARVRRDHHRAGRRG